MGPWEQQDRHPPAALTAAVGWATRAICLGGLAAVAALAGLALAGCDSPARSRPWRHAPDPVAVAAAEPPSADAVPDDSSADVRANRAHTLRVHVDAEPRGLNPLVAPSVWTRRIVMGTVFETLVRYAPPDGGAGAGPGRYVPGLAHSWRIDPDGLAIYFELEPGVTFHDGQALTAGDVQFSLDTARDPRKVGALAAALDDIKQVDKISPRMVRVQLVRPDGWILRALADVPILPDHVYDPNLAAGGKLVGTGPWALASWKNGVVHLSRYAGYWGRAPAIADLEFVYQPDAARALVDAKRGDLDLIPAMIPAHWPEQASAPGIATSFTTIALRPPRFRYLVLDTTGPPFDDVRVRRALALLVDRKGLCRDFLHGLARPVGGPVWPGGPADGAAPAPPDFDPDAAGKLLDEAGWTDADKDGLREKGADKLRFVMLLAERDTPLPPGKKLDPERDRMVELLRRAGFTVEVKLGSDAVVMKKLGEVHFGAALLEWDGEVDSDLSPWLETNGRDNLGKFSSKRFDTLFAALRADWDPAARVQHAAELALAIADEEPIITLAAPDPVGLIHRRVTGAVPWDGWLDLTKLAFDPKNDPIPAR